MQDMEEFEEFSVVFGGDIDLAYDHKTIEKLLKNRRLLESILFFDRLLGALGIKDGVYEQRPCIQQTKRLSASQLYPPKSNEDLRILYDSITSAPAQNHHKHSLVYYILKDLKLRNRDPETFATRVYLPERYRIFIDGIWYLDRLVLEVGRLLDAYI